MTRPLAFPRTLQVRSARDYKRAFAAKRSLRDGLVIAYVAANGLETSRVGTAISKRGRNAPIRNRIRRVLREAWRLERPQLPPGLDWVLVVPKHVRDLALEPTRASLRRIAAKLSKRLAAELASASAAGDVAE